MINKWAQGIEPRSFRWVIADRLAVCDRPGGYGVGHRRVRRREEIIWLGRHDIRMIITLTQAPYNLHDYDKFNIRYVHVPFGGPLDGVDRLQQIYSTVQQRVAVERVLLHRESMGERLTGFVAGYLLWTGLVNGGPNAITVTERLLERGLGPTARQIVTLTEQLLVRDG